MKYLIDSYLIQIQVARCIDCGPNLIDSLNLPYMTLGKEKKLLGSPRPPTLLLTFIKKIRVGFEILKIKNNDRKNRKYKNSEYQCYHSEGAPYIHAAVQATCREATEATFSYSKE